MILTLASRKRNASWHGRGGGGTDSVMSGSSVFVITLKRISVVLLHWFTILIVLVYGLCLMSSSV